LAVGAHLKNTVALKVGKEILLSPHIGDLDSPQAREAFAEVIERFQKFYETKPKNFACDLHPDYASSNFAEQNGENILSVQHHHAHVVSCMAEHDLWGTVLGIAWDGTGLGPDGTLWGGEFLRCNRSDYERVGHLRYFPLPGGEKAIREPRRSALGMLYEIFGEDIFARGDILALLSFSKKELDLLRPMLSKKLNSPRTCGVGRLFDAVSALLGLVQKASFEGQGAMALEFTAENTKAPAYPMAHNKTQVGMILNWEPMIHQILEDIRKQKPAGEISRKFHAALIEGIVTMAGQFNEERIILTGGCFQNKILCEGAIAGLKAKGFTPYWHQKIPPNDGGIALGQAMIALAREEKKSCA
jgi:hydrogenase maturation protein HypF